ncbi:MAG: EAL domain-containing protein [Gammaproteobacteria bacterium]|nr:EAL domain-containing protein [Gammaproteobacteria bacterium]
MIDEPIQLINDADRVPDTLSVNDASSWKLLVVDDNPEVHAVTQFVLNKLHIFGRPLRLLHAYSGLEAHKHLREHPDIAVALLDVVMETEQAGLDLVEYIRDELKLTECRIILRTGQPGYAPELAVIHEYDINDYRTKAELTHTRLISTVSAALRSYQQLYAIAQNRRGLELIAGAAADLMGQHTIAGLAEGVLTQLTALFKLPLDGIVCTQKDSPFGNHQERYYVAGAAGQYAPYITQPLEALPDKGIISAVHACVSYREHMFDSDRTVLYFKVASCQDVVIFLNCSQALAVVDRSLLEVFVVNIAACFRNAKLVERLLHAQQEIERQRSFLRTVIDTDPHFICVENQQHQIILANQHLARCFGLSSEQIVGHTFSDLITTDPELVQALRNDDEAILAQTQDRIEREMKCVDLTGRTYWVYTVKVPIKNPAGEVEQLISVGIDITERKQAEAALFAEREKALVTLHSIGDAVITTDMHGIVEYLNPMAEKLTDWSMIEAQGRPLGEIFHIVNEQKDQPLLDLMTQNLEEEKAPGLAHYSTLVSRHGRKYHIDDLAAPIRGREDQLLGTVLVFRDVTEIRRLTRQLEFDATHDALTGLINRLEFERRLKQALSSAHQHGARHALCYLDLDQFKIVNDTAGHAAGDDLLRKINRLISGVFRDRDTLARIGGDEFGLLLDNCPLSRAQFIAQNIVNSVRDYRFHWEGQVYQIGVSIGLAPITVETKNTTQLFAQADVACYIAKELGRNRVHVYTEEDSETAQRHSEILGAAGLRDALEKDRFRLHYQPIVSLSDPSQQPAYYEALLRIVYKGQPNEDSELVLPAAFIPAAERYGLMGVIDRWVIQAAFREYAAGIGHTSAKISINLSGNSLSDETLFDFIKAQFAEYAFSPAQVCFEVTETAVFQNLQQAIKLMTALKHCGSQFALDDFGSGLSSFRHLKMLPVDYLKIDGSFFKDTIGSDSDRALVTAITQMSHTLGIQTIAESVENQTVAEHLRELGVDYAQGFFFGHAAPWVQPYE